MCTAASYKTRDFYFGRTLDYAFSYGEEVVITPRRMPLAFREMGEVRKHYAFIGMAHVAGETPLYYDAVNEKGLAMAGLNFPGNAAYAKSEPGKENIATFEFIPWIMSRCASVAEAREALARMNLTDLAFAPTLPPATLHWMIADADDAIVVESMGDGLHVYANPVGVMTNNPTFPEQLSRLNDYMQLTPQQPTCNFSPNLDLAPYSLGMGAIGLPGDLSSRSRFVRAAFVRNNAVSDGSDTASVSQFFHILGAVEHPRGACVLADGGYEITIYTSCCNTRTGVYYYTTYDNHRIRAVDMHRVDLDGTSPMRYGLAPEEDIAWQN